MTKVLIYTDGAAKGNPGPGGWGAIIADETHVAEFGGGEAHTTNNRMELNAVLEALAFAKKYTDARITLYVDSQYVINGATLWGQAWIKRGWVTKQKEPVLNRDLWEPLLSLVDSFKEHLEWHNVGGHIGIPGNERVDAIADCFARGEETNLYMGSREAYKIDLADLSFDAAQHKARSESRTRSRQKAYSYVSAVDGQVQIHKTWKECEQRVRGKKARFKKALSAQEEKEIVHAFGGTT